MFKLTLKFANGSNDWIEKFPTEEKALAWIKEVIENSDWNNDNTYTIIDITPVLSEPTNAEILIIKWIKLRAKRDLLLTQSDWSMIGDAPLNNEQRALMADYRNKLRNLPETNSNPDQIVFPAFPKLR